MPPCSRQYPDCARKSCEISLECSSQISRTRSNPRASLISVSFSEEDGSRAEQEFPDISGDSLSQETLAYSSREPSTPRTSFRRRLVYARVWGTAPSPRGESPYPRRRLPSEERIAASMANRRLLHPLTQRSVMSNEYSQRTVGFVRRHGHS